MLEAAMPSVVQILIKMPPKERPSIAEGRVLQLERELSTRESLFSRAATSIASFSLIEGHKKLFGGYSETIFNTQMHNGTRCYASISTDGLWASTQPAISLPPTKRTPSGPASR
jgi:hypothetical protein